MSTENLKEYARRCATEPELLARAKEFGLTDMDKHMRYAESLGLDWTTGDLAAFRKEVIDAEGDFDDLSEEELEQVAAWAAHFRPPWQSPSQSASPSAPARQ